MFISSTRFLRYSRQNKRAKKRVLLTERHLCPFSTKKSSNHPFFNPGAADE
jgi:hypothetical protein